MELLYSGPEIDILEPGPFVDLYAGKYEVETGAGFVLFLSEYRNVDYAELVFSEALAAFNAQESRLAVPDHEDTVPYFAAAKSEDGFSMFFQSERFVGGALGVDHPSSAAGLLSEMISSL